MSPANHALIASPLHDHDHGLAHDLETMLSQAAGRRQMLGRLLVGAIAPLPLLGCGGGGSAAGTTTTTATTSVASTTTTTTATSSSCSVIPTETAGPYPADGTNTSNGSTSNAMAAAGVVRANIVSSFGSSSGSAVGVPLTITLTVVNTNASCASLAGYAVYLWHCDQLGRYSLYSSGATGENYLRGVQVTDSTGSVTFTSIYPACYSGRWPHIHFEVYASLAAATGGTGNSALKTSQIAMPASANSAVFATTTYTASVANYSAVSLATDGVFSDGATLETPTVTGSVSAGYAIALQVGVAA